MESRAAFVHFAEATRRALVLRNIVIALVPYFVSLSFRFLLGHVHWFLEKLQPVSASVMR
jgi:hypothetical protein